MARLLQHGIALGSGTLATVLGRLYMLHLRVPAVMDVRPELADVGLQSGLFGGRGMIYLWYHYPNAMTVVGFVTWFLALEAVMLQQY